MYFYAILFFILLCVSPVKAITVGAERYEDYLPIITGKRVGLVVNQSAQVKSGHLLDVLLSKGINVQRIFSPEHGFRGDHDAGAYVSSSTDAKTGIQITSLYGNNKRPTTEQLQGLDVILFDIQDVGVRFYTYISTMHYMMEAAANSNKTFVVLDRPNPNIAYVDGPILESPFRSFVGVHPIPVLHGMTVGELAQMIVGEGWLQAEKKLDLQVIPVSNYDGNMHYDLPIKPSPNLPNRQAIALYPSLCFFEATPVSVGRGTSFPFQVYGYSKVKLGTFEFKPEPVLGAAMNPKLNGESVYGVDLRNYHSAGLDLTWLIDAYQKMSAQGVEFFKHKAFMDKLAGTDKLRKAIESGWSMTKIRQSWQQPLTNYMQRRQQYLLYER